eukprot:CAMPEP_0195293072 /NCGR_PEP_ID=MMETSP0707-20130614/11583_1 /TAXON_ID=33640 /ORGANISM="Asterionellopsis glacialis, Strain CCMP134" /LENGTH=533 /DNA_ID=CAMNT_0040353701 /DNA_START=119 /DNA_END=1720 /DNA_ORIENTATION=+
MRHLLTDLRGNPITFAARRRQRRFRHPFLPKLWYLVKNRSWDDTIRRVRTHPHEVLIQEDISGDTPLHIACQLNPSAEVIRALLPASKTLNAEGATPLHVAATHRCSAAVIKTLLDGFKEDSADSKSVSPTAVLTRMGRAPIHYACMSFRGLSVDAFQVLLEATIQSGYVFISDNSDDADFPYDEPEDDLSASSETAGVNVMTVRDCSGQTPLGLLFCRYRERVRCVVKQVERLRIVHKNPSAASLAAAITIQADLGELWAKARLIVGKLTEKRLQREAGVVDLFHLDSASPEEAAVAHEAASWAAEQHRQYIKQTQDNSTQRVTEEAHKFRIVHASVGLTGYGCPPEMILLAISIHPEQVREMDEDGNLPLHIAAVASSLVTGHNGEGTSNVGDDASIVSDLSFLSNTTTVAKSCFDKVIKILLKHYPAAARIPHGRCGRLPFVLAIDSGRRTWNDGIRSLLEAFPPALESRRLPLNLYPSIVTLITRPSDSSKTESSWRKRLRRKNRKDVSSPTTLYEIIKAKPDLVKIMQ